MLFQPEIETMPRSQIEKLQMTRLRESLERCYHNVPLYRQRFDEAGLKPEDITSIEMLRKLPFTMKSDLRDNYPFGMFAVPRNQVIRYHGSSGTTGKPTTVGYTRKDLDTWSDLVARMAMAAGARPGDTAQISFGYGLFTGAFGLHYGLEKLGVGVVPMSSGNTERQLMIMQDYEPTVLVATPSYAVYMSELAREKGITENIKLRVGLFGAEGSTDEMRKRIEKNFNIIATDNYGMSELIGPGVSGECEFRNGQHIAEDHFIIEILDTETLEPVPDGEYGEVVVTSLTKECCPIIRYRTRDISRMLEGECPCGRIMRRLDRIKGRTDDMLIIKGVNVFPSQVESVLIGMESIGSHYQLVVRSKGFMDTLEVQVELNDTSLLERYSELEDLRSRVMANLHSVLGLDAKVTLVAPRTIERSQGKAKRVIDLRNKE